MTIVALLLALTAPAAAQPDLPPGHPPTQPQLPPGHPPADDPGQGPNMRDLRRILDRELSTARSSRDVPAGSIRVLVVDGEERPVVGATVQIGIMTQDQTRDRREQRTGADGTTTFRDLPRGTEQAYRVNVPHGGATYSSTPFQLDMREGHDVKIVRLPTTRDDRALLQFVSEVLIELRDDRVHVVQRIQLVNLGEQTYVFPAEGKVIRLPEGFLAFQTQPMMTDQKVDPFEGVGVKIRGSMPPGRVNLLWAYDLRIPGSEMAFTVEVPWRTYIFAVAAQAPPGLRLAASGMPPTELRTEQGERMLVTQVQRSPQDPPINRVTIRLEDIPGPGPWRWFAVFFALAFMVGGLVWALLERAPQTSGAEMARRRRELLEEARAIEEQHVAGEIGPVYRERRMEKVIVELAAVLRAEAGRKKIEKSAPRAH
jgi:hypothetical protein